MQSNRTGPGIKVHRWCSAQDPKGRREIDINEVRVVDEKRRSATPAGFAKQCALSNMDEGRTEKIQLAKCC